MLELFLSEKLAFGTILSETVLNELRAFLVENSDPSSRVHVPRVPMFICLHMSLFLYS